MASRSKRQVAIGSSPDVKAIRLRKLFRVAISGANTHRYLRACRHVNPAAAQIFGDLPVAELVRALVAQDFLYGGLDQTGFRSQARELLGMCQQAVHAVTDQVRRRLMTSVKQKYAILQQLFLGQTLTVFAAD